MSVLRSLLSALVLLVGLLVAAFALPATWMQAHLLDTDEWTSVVAPLIEEEPVRDTVSAALVAAVDREGNLPDWGREILTGVTDEVVASKAFAQVWADAVRISHQHMVEGIRGEGTGLDVSGDVVAVETASLFDALVPRLSEAGVPGLQALPRPDGRIVLEGSEATAQALKVAGQVDALAKPSVAVAGALLLLGVLLSRNPWRATAVAGLGVAAVALLEGVAWRWVSREWELRASGSTGTLVVESISDSVEAWLSPVVVGGAVVGAVGLAAALGTSAWRRLGEDA